MARGGLGGGSGGGGSSGRGGDRHHTGAVGRIGGGFHGAGLLDFAEHDKSQGVFGSLGAGVYGGIGQALGVRAVHDSSQGSSAFGRAGSHRGSSRVATSWLSRSVFDDVYKLQIHFPSPAYTR